MSRALEPATSEDGQSHRIIYMDAPRVAVQELRYHQQQLWTFMNSWAMEHERILDRLGVDSARLTSEASRMGDIDESCVVDVDHESQFAEARQQYNSRIGLSDGVSTAHHHGLVGATPVLSPNGDECRPISEYSGESARSGRHKDEKSIPGMSPRAQSAPVFKDHPVGGEHHQRPSNRSPRTSRRRSPTSEDPRVTSEQTEQSFHPAKDEEPQRPRTSSRSHRGPESPRPGEEGRKRHSGQRGLNAAGDLTQEAEEEFKDILAHAVDDFTKGATEAMRLAGMTTDVGTGRTKHGPIRKFFDRWIEPFAEFFYVCVSTPPPRTNMCFNRLVHRGWFLGLSSLVIVLNSGFFVVTIDYARSHPENPDQDTFDVIELLFCIFYTVELLLKMIAFHYRFFLSNEWTWNIFDTVLVAFAVSEQVQVYVIGGEPGANVSFLRGLRLLKLAKVLRVVRFLKVFTELRLIVTSILGSMRALQWSLVLVLAFDYLAALVFTQGVAGHLRDLPPGSPVPEEFDLYYSSVGQTMVSLYMSVTGGVDWGDVGDSLKDVGTLYYGLFIAYTAFYMWVLVNTLTSLFVESTMRNSMADQQQVAEDRLENKEKYIKMLREWYMELDPDGDGLLSYEEVQTRFYDPAMSRFAAMLDIEICDIKQFFLALSGNGTRSVDLDSFVVGCIKLKGTARSIDLLDLMHTHRDFVSAQMTFAAQTRHQFTELHQELRALRGGHMAMPVPPPPHPPHDHHHHQNLHVHIGSSQS